MRLFTRPGWEARLRQPSHKISPNGVQLRFLHHEAHPVILQGFLDPLRLVPHHQHDVFHSDTLQGVY